MAGGGDSSGGSAGDGGQQSSGGSGGKASGGSAGKATAGSGGVEVLPDCVETRLSDVGANLVRVDTGDRANEFTLSCGAGQSPDIAFVWTAPESDYYAIDTAGSDFDTVLALYDGCGGTELTCNNNYASSSQSQVVTRFSQGQEVIIAVDGNSGETGEALVSIARVTCPEVDLTGQTFPAALSTETGTTSQAGLCGGAGFREKTYRYTPSVSGFHRFSVDSNAIAPALHLELGAQCGGELLQCNAGASSNWATEITRYLEANEPVTLIVDSTSGEGNFNLDIQPLTEAVCAESRLLPEEFEPVLDTVISGDSHLLSASCHAAGGMVQVTSPFVEHRYALDVNEALTSCYYTIYSDYVLYAYMVRGANCAGSEARCLESVVNIDDDIYPQYTDMITLSFTLADVGQYVLVIETPIADGFPVNYEIVKTCFI